MLSWYNVESESNTVSALDCLAKDDMAARLKDVADRVGVSIKTVSNVVNGRNARVSAATRARVLAAIEELGYRPHAAAQGLRTRRSHTLGFISDEVAFTPYAGAMIKGAHDLCWAHGKILMIVNTDRDPATAAAAVETMLERRVGGGPLAPPYPRLVPPPPTTRGGRP